MNKSFLAFLLSINSLSNAMDRVVTLPSSSLSAAAAAAASVQTTAAASPTSAQTAAATAQRAQQPALDWPHVLAQLTQPHGLNPEALIALSEHKKSENKQLFPPNALETIVRQNLIDNNRFAIADIAQQLDVAESRFPLEDISERSINGLVSVSPNKQFAALSACDGGITVINLKKEGKDAVKTLKGPGKTNYESLSFNSDSSHIIGFSHKVCVIWPVPTQWDPEAAPGFLSKAWPWSSSTPALPYSIIGHGQNNPIAYDLIVISKDAKTILIAQHDTTENKDSSQQGTDNDPFFRAHTIPRFTVHILTEIKKETIINPERKFDPNVIMRSGRPIIYSDVPIVALAFDETETGALICLIDGTFIHYKFEHTKIISKPSQMLRQGAVGINAFGEVQIVSLKAKHKIKQELPYKLSGSVTSEPQAANSEDNQRHYENWRIIFSNDRKKLAGFTAEIALFSNIADLATQPVTVYELAKAEKLAHSRVNWQTTGISLQRRTNDCVFSPDDKLCMANSGSSGHLYLFNIIDINNIRCIALPGHQIVQEIAIDSSGMAVSAGLNPYLTYWDCRNFDTISSYSPQQLLERHADKAVKSIAMSDEVIAIGFFGPRGSELWFTKRWTEKLSPEQLAAVLAMYRNHSLYGTEPYNTYFKSIADCQVREGLLKCFQNRWFLAERSKSMGTASTSASPTDHTAAATAAIPTIQ